MQHKNALGTDCNPIELLHTGLQGQAEMFLEKLNGVVEKDLANLLEEFRRDAPALSEMAPNGAINADLASSPERQAVWSKFREQLIGLTEVTRTHFVKLVQVLALPFPPSRRLPQLTTSFSLSMSVSPEEFAENLAGLPELGKVQGWQNQ